MGIKRLNRSRLYNVEKKGLKVNISPSQVMEPAIVSATQQREGHKVITDVVVDLGATAAALKTKALAAADPIGNGTGASYICNITEAVFGIVTTIDVVTLEAITDGTLTDYDVMIAGDGNLDGDVSSGNAGSLGTDAQGSPATVATEIGTAGFSKTVPYDDWNGVLKNRFVYITSGDKTGQRASAEIRVTDAVLGNLVTGMNALRLIDSSDGTTAIPLVFDTTKGWDQAAQAGKIHIGGTGATPAAGSNLDNAKKLTYAISTAIEGTAGFTTNAASRAIGGGDAASNETVITVTRNQASPTATENTAITVVDAYDATGITATAFTGGIDDGQAMSSGKVLLRFTGFVVPDDI